MLKKTCRWLGGRIGYLLYTLVLLVLLLWVLFPKEIFHRLLVQYINTAYPQLNWQVQSITLQIPEGVTLWGIEGYEVWDQEKPRLRVDSLMVRPDVAGSVRTRTLQAAYRMILARGVIAGTLQMDGRGKGLRVDGSVQGVQLAECPIVARQLDREIQGTVTATFGGSVQPMSGEIPEVEVRLMVDNGRLGLKRPILAHWVLPFSRAAVILRGRGGAILLEQGTVDSELFSGQFSGDLQLIRNSASSQLDIRGTMQPQPAFFKDVDNASVLKVMRTQLKDRTVPFRVSGDLFDPGIHFEEFSLLFQSLEKELQ